MKRIVSALSTVLILIGALGAMPTLAFADENLYAEAYPVLGTVETNAVTKPIEVGGITYIPCGGACGGSSISSVGGFVDVALFAAGDGFYYEPLGTVETPAVTKPIEVGGITYIPCGPCTQR